MKATKITVLVMVAGFAAGCNKSGDAKKEQYAELKKVEWLAGRWENNSSEGNLSEEWTKDNDSTYSGQTFFIRGNDTLHRESIVLSQRGNKIIYSPTVEGQNQGKPIDFALSSASENQLVFENPKHNYPQKIVYNKITSDSLVAVISGVQQGKPGVEQFGMKKK